MTEAVTYKQPRKFNWVVILILLVLISGAYLAWLYLPIALRKSEVMRVLDETSSEFTGQASRFLADKKLVDRMLRDMTGDIRGMGVEDPDAEFWIEIDSDDQIRFGVLYSEWIELPFSEPREKVVELQMYCSRPGRGAGWTCEGQDLQSSDYISDQPLDPQAP